MASKWALATLTLALLTLSVPASSHALEERAAAVQKESVDKQSEAQLEPSTQKAEQAKGQSIMIAASSEPPKDKQRSNSFLQDQLEQKSPVYLWVPKGGVGVGFAMTW